MATTLTEKPVVPDWAVPEHEDVIGALSVSRFAFDVTRLWPHAGTFVALQWAVGLRAGAPMSGRVELATSRNARAESWLAVSHAAEAIMPTDLDWRRLRVEPRSIEVENPSAAYGIWTALDWLLGRRDEPPVALPGGPDGDVYVMPPDEDPAKREAHSRQLLEQYRAEARRHWSRLRQIADAQTAQR